MLTNNIIGYHGTNLDRLAHWKALRLLKECINFDKQDVKLKKSLDNNKRIYNYMLKDYIKQRAA